MPSLAAQFGVDVALLGLVFALILFILVISAIVLYLAFRIKETFREETRRGVVVAKVAFLVGVLFLAAGGLYFLAQVLSPSSPSVGGSSPTLTFSLSYPSEVSRNATFTFSVTVTNPTELVAHGAVIQTNVLFQEFTVLSSTHAVTGNIVTLGDVAMGTVIVSVELLAPDMPGTVTDTISLIFAEAEAAQTEGISITVTGGP